MVVTLNTALISKTSFTGNKNNKAAPMCLNQGVHNAKPVAKNPMRRGLFHNLGKLFAGTAFAGLTMTSCSSEPGFKDLIDTNPTTTITKDTAAAIDTIPPAQRELTIGEIYSNELDSLKIRDAEHKGQDVLKVTSYHSLTGTLIEQTKDVARSNNDSLVLNQIESIPGTKYKGYTVNVLKKLTNNSYIERNYDCDKNFNIDFKVSPSTTRHELRTAKEGRLDYIGKTLNSMTYNVAKDSLVDESAFSHTKHGIKIRDVQYATTTGIQPIRMSAAASSDTLLKAACKNAAKAVVSNTLKHAR